MGIHEKLENDKYLPQLFFALISSIMSAIIFYRFWVLRYLYQPYVVYANIAQLKEEHNIQEMWLELLECTYKAINDKRLSDGNNFLLLLEQLCRKTAKKEKINALKEDLVGLYKLASPLRPLQRQMEEQWPFLIPVPSQTSDLHKHSTNKPEPIKDPIYVGLDANG
jgi:hypothetical protein